MHQNLAWDAHEVVIAHSAHSAVLETSASLLTNRLAFTMKVGPHPFDPSGTKIFEPVSLCRARGSSHVALWISRRFRLDACERVDERDERPRRRPSIDYVAAIERADQRTVTFTVGRDIFVFGSGVPRIG